MKRPVSCVDNTCDRRHECGRFLAKGPVKNIWHAQINNYHVCNYFITTTQHTQITSALNGKGVYPIEEIDK